MSMSTGPFSCNNPTTFLTISSISDILTDLDFSVSPALIRNFSLQNIALISDDIKSMYTSTPYSFPWINGCTISSSPDSS